MFDIRCRICDAIVYQSYKLATSHKLWYHCACGCMFNDDYVKPEEFFTPERQAKQLENIKNPQDRYDYMIRCFAPLIEEKVYGRKMLDVGFGSTTLMKGMKERGWVVDGIDVASNEYITGNFETYDFWAKDLERYDLIWMGDVLQCFDNPVKAIYKAYNLLKPFGILMIITPNTDLMRANRIPGWGHWDMKENRQFLSEALLKEVIARADESLTGRMRIVYCDPHVTSKRFITTNNMHLMAQKFKIEDMPKVSDIEVQHEAVQES